MGTFFRNKLKQITTCLQSLEGSLFAELLEGAATVWTAGQVLKDNYTEISSAAAVGIATAGTVADTVGPMVHKIGKSVVGTVYRGIGSIFGRNPNSTIDSTQLAAVQHLKKIIAV